MEARKARSGTPSRPQLRLDIPSAAANSHSPFATFTLNHRICSSIDPNIDVEVDYPSKYPDKMMSILDMKMKINSKNEVVHAFFRKPQANKFTMMARSALPEKVKRSTLTNEALRRLLCCSSNLEEAEKVKIMEDFARMLKRSGYSEKFRYEVISDALRGHQKMRQREIDGGQPVDRPREYEEVARRRKKDEVGR